MDDGGSSSPFSMREKYDCDNKCESESEEGAAMTTTTTTTMNGDDNAGGERIDQDDIVKDEKFADQPVSEEGTGSDLAASMKDILISLPDNVPCNSDENKKEGESETDDNTEITLVLKSLPVEEGGQVVHIAPGDVDMNATFSRASMEAALKPKAETEKKNLRERRRRLGYPVDSDEEEEPVDVSRAMSLSVFKTQIRMKVQMSALSSEPRIARRIVGRPRNDKGEVVLEFPSSVAVEAFASILRFIVAGSPVVIAKRRRSSSISSRRKSDADRADEIELNRVNQFELFSAASTLGAMAAKDRIQDYIIQNLRSDTFFKAVQLAERCGETEFKAALFGWLRRSECVTASEKEALAPAGLKKRQSSSGISKIAKKVLGSKKRSSDIVDTSGPPIFYDGQGNLRLRDKIVSTLIFRDVIADAIRTKKRFFEAGDCRGPGAPPLPEIPREDDKEEGSNGGRYGKKKRSTKKKKHGYPGMVQCYVDRLRGMGDKGDETHFVMKLLGTDEVLLSACNVTGSTSFYFATRYPSRFQRGAPDFLAHVKCNFVGTVFTMFDHGCSAEEIPPEAFPAAARCEHGAILYETNVMGRVPNAMTVVIPNADGKHVSRSGLGVVRRYQKKMGGIMKLRTKKPVWNADLDAWTMDFHGRVKLASKKNFQLVDYPISGSSNARSKTCASDPPLMLFGKLTKHRFSLDYRAPLSAVQVLAVALSSFADKLMVT